MAGRKQFSILLAVLLLPVCAQATGITFTSDANIHAGDTWGAVSIYDTSPNHTTINMYGGSVTDQMNVYNASTLNMSGGNVGGLNALNESTVNISGGSVIGLQLFNNATATLSQNGSIEIIAAYNTGFFNMNGGTVTFLHAEESSTLNLYGGAITDLLVARVSTTVNVFGYGLAKTNTGGTYGEGQITGFWQDTSPFTINIGGPDTYSRINLIPEPTTLLLFGMGAFLLRKSR